MSLLERLENFKHESADHPDIIFLKNSELGSVVNKGLAELYKIQPKNPVTFFANWLLNESRSVEIKKKIDHSNDVKAHLKTIYAEEQKHKEAERSRIEAIHKEITDKKLNFLDKIKHCKDFEHNLDSYCEELKTLTNATGTYIMVHDKKRKINISEAEDETAHLLEEIVLRYIHFCSDHFSLLKNRYLEPNTGVSYEIVTPKDDGSDEANNNKQNDDLANNEDGKDNLIPLIKKEILPKHKEISEVIGSVDGAKVKFFREPRLGSYFAVDLSYNTALSQASLLSAFENKKEYDKNLGLQEERRREHDSKYLNKEKEKEKGDVSGEGKDAEDIINQDASLNKDNEGFVEENVELVDYKKTEKKMILCLDTLGQDRPFTEEERRFIFDTVKAIKTTREKCEDELLIKDRDLKIDMDGIDAYLKEQFTIEKIDLEEDKYVKEYFASEKFLENPIHDERTKLIEADFKKTRFNIQSFHHDENIKNVFLMYNKFEFVEFERLFQNILYFIGVSNSDINEENTNKLDWKKARKYWDGSVLDKLKAYTPFGSKTNKPTSFAMGNRLMSVFESINREELRAYSFTLSRLHDFVTILLRVRRDDILRRRDVVNELIEKRRVAIEDARNRTEKREVALEDEKRKFAEMEEGSEPLNEEEFLNKWDDETPEILIPDEVNHDIDCDMDVEKLISY